MAEKVAIYCRLSEEDKNKRNQNDDSESIQNQKIMLREYSEKMGWEIYGIYSDDDYAGSDRNRPAFKRLLYDAEHHRFDIVLCKTQSRFTRELELVEKYIHGLFPLWGIRFISIVDNADTANKGNKKSRQINGLVNEWYLEDMSDSIKAALDSRRKNGYHIGSFALYGYKKDPDIKGHLIIDEEAAAVVRKVFDLFSQGYGKTAIARMLNEEGIPNPTEYKRRQGLRFKLPPSKSSTIWKYFAISNMLTNEIYIGNMVQGKYESVSYKSSETRPRPKEEWYIVRGTHEPIIEMEQWNRVQKMIGERTKPFLTGNVGIFAKKTRCFFCGYALRSSKSGGRRFLSCPNHHFDKNSCEGVFVSEERLEKTIIGELNRLSLTYLDRRALEEIIEDVRDIDIDKSRISAEIMLLKKQMDEMSRGLKELYIDKVRRVITEEEFIELSKDFTDKREIFRDRISKCEKRLMDIEARQVPEFDRSAIVDKYIKIDHLTREMVEILIDKIVVGKRIQGSRNVPIEIYWNF